MKTPVYKIVSLLVFVLVCSFSGVAQTYATNNDSEDSSEELVRNRTISADIFAALGIDTSPNPRNNEISGNSVFLQQVGDFNQVALITETDASEINITQNGDENFTFLGYKTRTAVTDVLQNGFSNDAIDYVYKPGEDVSLDLVQDGDNLYFERFGANNLTKSLKFRQTEASPTVIVRSFQ